MSQDGSLRKIAHASMITATGTLISFVFILAKGKSIALLAGTEGIGLLAQFTSLQALASGIAGLGLSLGMTKYVSEYLADRDYDRIAGSGKVAFVITLVSSVITGVFIAALSVPLALFLTGDSSTHSYLLIIGISVPLASLTSLFNGIVNGAKAIKTLAWISVFSSLGSLLATIPLVYSLGREGIILQITISAGISLVITLVALRRVTRAWPLKSSSKLRLSNASCLLRYGSIQLSTGVFHQATMLLTQLAVISMIGLSANGLYQSAWSLWWPYISLAMTSISIYMLPVMSAARSEEELSLQANNSLRLLLLFTTPISVFLILSSKTILGLFFSPEFFGAGLILELMGLATIFRVFAYPLALRFTARAYVRYSLINELVWYLTLGLFMILLLPHFGIVATGIAVLGSNLAYSVFIWYNYSAVFGGSYSTENMRAFYFSLAAVLGAFAFATLHLGPWSFVLGMVALIPWAMATLNANERSWLKSRYHALVGGEC